MRIGVNLLLGVLALSVFADAQAGTLDIAKARGALIVGVRQDFLPFGYLDERGKNTGLEVDLARYLARQLFGDDSKLQFSPVTAGDRITALVSRTVDMLIAGVTVTDYSSSVFAFSEPYFTSGSLLLVSRNSSIKSLEDLKGRKVAVVEGTLQEKGLEQLGREATRIKFWTVPDAVEALLAGKVDAFAEDDVLVRALSKKHPSLSAVGTPFNSRPIAVAMPKDEPALLAWVNDQLRKARADGTYDTLWKKYFGEAGAMLVRP
jgi:ABC-type amino acid transport substrate-binding protein